MNSRLPFCLFFIMFSALLWYMAERFTLRGWTINGGDAIARVSVEKMMREMEGRSLAALRLPLLREQIMRQPGVADAALRRQLPDSLEIRLIEHRPLASWADGGLVDVWGVRYDGFSDKWLPQFSGPAERAASMADFYTDARDMLDKIGATIAHLRVDDNGEWRIFLSDGLMLQLGRDNLHKRVRRYVRHAAELRLRFAQIRAVDLRYEKGFSISLDDGGQT